MHPTPPALLSGVYSPVYEQLVIVPPLLVLLRTKLTPSRSAAWHETDGDAMNITSLISSPIRNTRPAIISASALSSLDNLQTLHQEAPTTLRCHRPYLAGQDTESSRSTGAVTHAAECAR